jgi:hypothetical protein
MVVMRLALFLILLLLPSVLPAHAEPPGCWSAETAEHPIIRISGKVVHVSFEDPNRDRPIEGYKLVLLKPRCFDTTSAQTDQKMRIEITEVALLEIWSSQSRDAIDQFWAAGINRHRWEDMAPFLKQNVGKYIIVTGTIEDYSTAGYLVSPQIAVGSYAPCAIVPKTKAMEKC